MKKVIVTGILGQDGANMAEYLLKDPDLRVYGMSRRVSVPNFKNIKKFKSHKNFKLIFGDLTDTISVENLVKEIQPDYFINFGANSFVGCSWDMPLHVMDVNANGVLRCLEAIRKFQPNCRFYSAGSSEQFGDVDYSPQDMKHPMKPRSPYGASKCAAHHLVKVYRDSYDMYAVHGILFNHEGTKRGEEFVTRKITKGVARIYEKIYSVDSWRTRHGDAAVFDPIELGNLDSKRDWSDSEDFVEGVWLMLNQDDPKDYLLASGETHSIREFVEAAFTHAAALGGPGCSFDTADWVGEGVNEKYVMHGKHKYVLVKVNPDFYRPAEIDLLLGDPSEAMKKIGWKPKNSFDDLVKKMVVYDISDAPKEYKTRKM